MTSRMAPRKPNGSAGEFAHSAEAEKATAAQLPKRSSLSRHRWDSVSIVVLAYLRGKMARASVYWIGG